MERYTIYCTDEQTRKALELGAPISFNKVGEGRPSPYLISRENRGYYAIPTAEQMIGWLRIEKGLYVEPYLNGECCYSFSPIISTKEDGEIMHLEAEDSFEEATLAAIGAALDYLSKNKR